MKSLQDGVEPMPAYELAAAPTIIADSFTISSAHTIDFQSKVATNLFRVSLKLPNYIYVYAVSFENAVTSEFTALRKKYIDVMEGAIREKFGRYVFVGPNLFSERHAGNKVKLSMGDLQVQAIFKRVSMLSVADIRNSNNSPNRKDDAREQAAATFLNHIIRSLTYSSGLTPSNSAGSFLKMEEACHIKGTDLKIVPGYKATIRSCDDGILLGVGYTPRVISERTVYQELKKLEGKPDYQEKAREKFANKSVATLYGKKRAYLIEDIAFNKNPNTESKKVESIYRFTAYGKKMEEKREVNVSEYMLKRYGIKIEHKRQPLLLHEVCKKGYHKGVEHLVPELCTLVGVPDSVKMNGSISKKISNKTKPKLSVKKKKLAAFLNIFSEKEKVKEEEVNDKEEKKMGGAKSDYKLPKDILEEWNLKVNLVPTKANARTTLSVNVMLDNNATMSAIRAAPMNQILKPVMIKEWLIVHHIDKEAQAAQFTEAISRKAEEFGISMEHPTRKATETISCQGYIDAMEEHIKDGGKPQIVVCILSTKSPSDYNEIKKWAITRSSFIQTQIVRSTTLDNKKEKPYHYSNILLQMNAKMGAELWRVDQLKNCLLYTSDAADE
eukprot:TRINITY_DN12092_c0_g3_i3.p1 TRINITY_DN12092_c0_g3~~TRINITY_DN12092_c0_g3_i3.p1  ORF type:complete len:611 (-),score=123.52 TRINITY_DN12092_c0_g3_i3:52-1884(-)